MEPSSIRDLRQRLRETQSAFGARFQVSQITVASWESGRSKPVSRRLAELNNLIANTTNGSKTELPFRPIQYLGSKQRLALIIRDIMAEVAPGNGRVGDLFAGSGVVSQTLAAMRPVTSVDVQAYSKVLNSALLTGLLSNFEEIGSSLFLTQLTEEIELILGLIGPLIEYEQNALSMARSGKPDQLVDLIEFGSLAVYSQLPSSKCPPALSKVLRAAIASLETSQYSHADLTATFYFGGPYFSFAQSVALDAIYLVGRRMKRSIPDCCTNAVLLSTASEIVNTVGKQFAQPMKLMKPDGLVSPLLLQRALRDRTLDTITVFQIMAKRWASHTSCQGGDHRVERMEVGEFVAGDISCCAYYADPPYTIDHYSRFYHVLETLVCRDSPHLDKMKKQGQIAIMRGIYRVGRFQSAFSIPSAAPAAFDQLFSAISKRRVPLVLSYSPFDEQDGSRPRLLTLSQLIASAEKYFSKVSISEISEHTHRKLNAKSLNMHARTDAERLLICEA